MASPSCSVLVEAIGAVLEDPSFSTTSPVAVDALQSSKVIQDWYVSENNTVVVSFTAELLTDLEGALILPSGRHLLQFGSSTFVFVHQRLLYLDGQSSWTKQMQVQLPHSTSISLTLFLESY